MSPTDTPPTREVVALLYGEVCRSHADIADFARSSSRSSPSPGAPDLPAAREHVVEARRDPSRRWMLGFVVTLGLFF